MYCTRCGKILPDGNRFCIYCGMPAAFKRSAAPSSSPAPVFSYAQPPQSLPLGRPAKKKRTWLLVVLGTGLVAAIVLVLFLAGVFSDGPAEETLVLPGLGNGQGLSLGKPLRVAEEVIGPSGESLTIGQGNGRLTGLVVDVPTGCYTKSLSFSVSEVPVRANGFDKDLVILTPLIRIENGDEYADNLMTVRIPCQVPVDHVPLGFYYDVQNQELESVPVMSMDESSVTLGLRHFSDLCVGAVSERAVDVMAAYDSGFCPGVDDFNMVNNGSTLSPSGHCAGQSLATMWYYKYRKLAGMPSLWNRFDNYGKDAALNFPTPNMQHDDVMALRIASVAQKEASWNSSLRESFLRSSQLSDRCTFQGIKYAIKLHKSPQYLNIQSVNASGETISVHAIIAYRSEGNRIYVADPNYPGRTDRFFEFKDGKIQPYSSARTAEEAAAGQGLLYSRINLVGFSALYNHQKMADLWHQLDARTVGDTYFPDSEIKLYTAVMTPEGEKEEEIITGYKAKTAKLEIRRLSANTALDYYFFHADKNGTLTSVTKNDRGIFVAPLKLGTNYIGILEYKTVDGKKRWHDFKWLLVDLPFPYAGTWQGTIRVDEVNLPHPDSAAAASVSGCDQIPLELYNQLKALEDTSQNAAMSIVETDVDGTYKATVNFDGELPVDPGIDADSLEMVKTDHVLKGEFQPPESKIVISVTLEPDSDSADKIKGTFSVMSLDDKSLGIFMSIQMTRIGDTP